MSEFGLTTWDEKLPSNKPQKKQQQDRIPFIRMQPGNNIMRVITMPAKYWFVKIPTAKSPYGERVNSAYPGPGTVIEDGPKKGRPNDVDPVVKAGFWPRPGFFVGVIHRDNNGETTVKICDMRSSVYEALQGFMDDPEVGPPTDYDINVRYNPDSDTPQNYYSVIPRPAKPLSEKDLELIESVGRKNIEDTLVRLATPPSIERVDTLLREKFGWDGESNINPKAKQSKNNVKAASDADFDFNEEESSDNTEVSEETEDSSYVFDEE